MRHAANAAAVAVAAAVARLTVGNHMMASTNATAAAPALVRTAIARGAAIAAAGATKEAVVAIAAEAAAGRHALHGGDASAAQVQAVTAVAAAVAVAARAKARAAESAASAAAARTARVLLAAAAAAPAALRRQSVAADLHPSFFPFVNYALRSARKRHHQQAPENKSQSQNERSSAQFSKIKIWQKEAPPMTTMTGQRRARRESRGWWY